MARYKSILATARIPLAYSLHPIVPAVTALTLVLRPTLHQRKRNVIGLFVVSVLLFAIQAGLWIHSLAPARTETDKQNIEGHHPPTDLPILAGSLLLIVAAAVASIPPRVATHRHRS